MQPCASGVSSSNEKWAWAPSTEMGRLLSENREELLTSAPLEISQRQRIALVVGTDLLAEEALTMEVATVTAAWLASKRIGLPNLLAADLFPLRLFRLGVATTADAVAALGFDALSLFMHPRVAAEGVALFGEAACRGVWLRTPQDAIALAGGVEACRAMDVTVQRLLEACESDPGAAECVLMCIENPGVCLRAVSVGVIVRTGIDVAKLTRARVTLNDIMAAGASQPELRALGYKALRLLG